MKWIFFLSLCLSLSSFAADKKAVLRWGADVESGAPYAYKDPSNPEKLVGFEAEVMEALAQEMGMELQFVQNSWDGLVEGLQRKDYDVVANGLEITADRQEVVHFSIPYYTTGEILTVQASSQTIEKLEDTEGKRVGTLTGAVAQRILAEQSFPLEVVTYSEEVHAYNDLAMGRLAAVFMDEPIALYYAKPNPKLKNVGELIGRMDYGIAIRKEDKKLQADVDKALAKLIKNGALRKILERWGLWNKMSAEAFKQSVEPQSPAVMLDEYLKTAMKPISWEERAERYISFLPLLGKGAIMTLQVSVLAMVLAVLVGLLLAMARLYGPFPLSALSLAAVEVLRGTPLLIQLFLIFYGLPHIGIRLDPFLAAVIGLGVNYGACEAENYRAGILAIPKTQMDASRALGMSFTQSLRHIILPQAMRIVLPPVTNDFIALLKDSSLVSVITMVELTATYGQLASTYFDYLGIGLLTAAVYFTIGLPFVYMSRRFESKLNVHLAGR